MEDVRDIGVCLRSADIKGVQQRTDILAAWMFPGSLFDTSVYLQLIVRLLPHQCGLCENLEDDIAMIAVFSVSLRSCKKTIRM